MRRRMSSRVKMFLLIASLGLSMPLITVASTPIHRSESTSINLQEDETKRKRPPKKSREKKENTEKETPKTEQNKDAEKTEKEKPKDEAKNQGLGWGAVVLTVFLTLGATAGGLFLLWKYKAKSVVRVLESSDKKSEPIVVEASVIHTEPIVAKKDAEPLPPEKPRQIERLPARDAISYKDAPKFEEPSGASALDESPMLFDDTALNSDASGNTTDAAMINQLLQKQSDKDKSKSEILDSSDDLISPDSNADDDLIEISKREAEKQMTPTLDDMSLDENLLNGTLLDDSAFTTVALYNAATTPDEQHAFAEQMIPCMIENFDVAVKTHSEPVLTPTPDGIFLVSKTPLDGVGHYELFVLHELKLDDIEVQSCVKPAFKVFYSDDVETAFQIKTPAMVTKRDDRWTLSTQGEILLKA